MRKAPTPSMAEAAQQLGCSPKTVDKWLRHWTDIPRRRVGDRNWQERPADPDAHVPHTRDSPYLQTVERFQEACEARGVNFRTQLMELMDAWVNEQNQ